jgi:hypothetical protein
VDPKTVRPQGVPRHHRELAGQAVDLAAPLPAVHWPSVQENERRPVALPLIGDPVANDLDLIHHVAPTSISSITIHPC